MTKIFIDGEQCLENSLLRDKFTVVNQPDEADIIIYFSTERFPWIERERCIMVQVEPPLAPERQQLYRKEISDQFHTVYTYNPQPTADNQFPLTDNPLFYPYNPRPELRDTRQRSSISRYYYAGHRDLFANASSTHGSFNLYPMRTRIIEHMIKKEQIPGRVVGKGWGTTVTRHVADFRAQKMHEIARLNADYVFCMENSYFPNYISEKIHDGFNADCLVLYLGEPNITKWVPNDCFINLNPILHTNAPEEWLDATIDEIYSRDYLPTINRARQFRDDVIKGEEHQKRRLALTNHIISRIC